MTSSSNVSLARGRRPDSEAERTPGAEQNWILRSLSPEEHAQLRPHLERVNLAVLEVLAEAGGALEYAYFPETAIISVVRPIDDTLVEAGTVGREGMAGLAALLGATWTPSKLLGQIPGTCTRIDFVTLARLLPGLPGMQRLLGRFTLSFLDQVGQTVACNTRHSVLQRSARWLLLTRDRLEADTIRLTHEVLSQMLGVRRAGVSEALAALQRSGLIRYSRGKVAILDRPGLERLTCECYWITRKHFARLMGDEGLPGS